MRRSSFQDLDVAISRSLDGSDYDYIIAVAKRISEITAVATEIADPNTDLAIVAADLDLGAGVSKIMIVADNVADINTLVTNEADIQLIADHINGTASDDITQVAANLTDINTVAANDSNITNLGTAGAVTAMTNLGTAAVAQALVNLTDSAIHLERLTDSAADMNDISMLGGVDGEIALTASVAPQIVICAAKITEIDIVAMDLRRDVVDDPWYDVNNPSNINAIGPLIDKVETTADHVDGTASMDIPLLADNIDGTSSTDIPLIADHIDGTISTVIADLAGNVGDVTTVATNVSDVNLLADHIDGTVSTNITTVATDIANVNAVGDNIASVVTVANAQNLADVITVANDLNEVASDIDLVGADLYKDLDGDGNTYSSINAVGASIGNVDIVAAGIGDINSYAESYFGSQTTTSTWDVKVDTFDDGLTKVSMPLNDDTYDDVGTFADVDRDGTFVTGGPKASYFTPGPSFDGFNGNSTAALTDTSWSVSMWLEFPLTLPDSGMAMLVGCYEANNTADVSPFAIESTGDIGYWAPTNVHYNNTDLVNAVNNLAPGWHNLIITFSPNFIYYYLDGVQVPGVQNWSSGYVTNICSNYGGGSVYKGAVTDIRVFDNVLGATERDFLSATTSFDTLYTAVGDTLDTYIANNGITLNEGDQYFDTNLNASMTYDGASWEQNLTAAKAAIVTNKVIDDASNTIGADHIHYKIKNETGATLTKGTLVKIVGYQTGEDAIRVETVASYDDVAIGICNEDILTGQYGLAINTGTIEDIDTNAYAVNTILYSNGAGGLTDVKPDLATAPLHYQAVGVVTRSQSNTGSLLVEFTEPTSSYTRSETDAIITETKEYAIAMAIALG